VPKAPTVGLSRTTPGTMIADGFGIIVGNVMGKHIPERTIKCFSLSLPADTGFTKTF